MRIAKAKALCLWQSLYYCWRQCETKVDLGIAKSVRQKSYVLMIKTFCINFFSIMPVKNNKFCLKSFVRNLIIHIKDQTTLSPSQLL
jgi:hypothetical protein